MTHKQVHLPLARVRVLPGIPHAHILALLGRALWLCAVERFSSTLFEVNFALPAAFADGVEWGQEEIDVAGMYSEAMATQLSRSS